MNQGRGEVGGRAGKGCRCCAGKGLGAVAAVAAVAADTPRRSPFNNAAKSKQSLILEIQPETVRRSNWNRLVVKATQGGPILGRGSIKTKTRGLLGPFIGGGLGGEGTRGAGTLNSLDKERWKHGFCTFKAPCISFLYCTKKMLLCIA